MGIDVNKLKTLHEEIEKRTQGSAKNWLNAKKIDGSIDVRIMEPLPDMEGIYYLEVPVWWVNGNKLISPKFFGEDCPVEIAIAEAKTAKDPDVLALLSAKDGNMKKVDFKYEYWIPILQFDWRFNKAGNAIADIYDKNGAFDVNLIKSFIVDERVKMFQVGVSLLKSINAVATARGGGDMTESETGFNLNITRTGAGRDTKYGATKQEAMPMPIEFYENQVSPHDILKALMYTNEYMDSVIGEYLWGEERKEETYRFPEIKAALKARFEEEAEAPAKKGARPSRTAAPEQAEQRVTEKETAPTTRGGAAAGSSRGVGAAAGATRTRGAAAGAEEKPARGRGRNIVDDMANVEDK